MAVKHQAFLDLEASLVKELQPRIIKITAQIVPRLVDAIEDKDSVLASSILAEVTGEKIYRGKLTKIRNLFAMGLAFGASRVSGTARGLHTPNTPEAKRDIEVVLNQFKLQLSEITRTYRQRMNKLVVDLLERRRFEEAADEDFTKSEVVQKIVKINLPDVLSKRSTSIGRNMIDVASSLQMSRVSQYGFAVEATARGITTYRINEVLDGRTCPVCREMHGKEFKVKNALFKLDTLIRITEPTDLKLLAPFPRQDKESLDELAKMTPEELQQKGFDTPPFHPSCRGLLTSSQDPSALSPAQADSAFIGIDEVQQIQPRVAEFLESFAGQNLTIQQREIIIGASAGVTDFSRLPNDIKNLIADTEDSSVVR